VINNASILPNLNWGTTTIDDWRKNQSVNLETPFLISQAFAKSLKEGDIGKIINMLDWRVFIPRADLQ
jgi:NAD(P)-dependent dehydrogenase (short-subunit alcohol dehydrogenase family)